jgi:SAM-dependent methyltransferase
MAADNNGWVNFSPAAERNQTPVLAKLQTLLKGDETVLEVGSGSGQHALHFCAAMNGLRWIPSDIAELLPGLEINLNPHVSSTICSPELLDLRDNRWHTGFATVDVIYSANTLHIVSWPEVVSLFDGVARLFKPASKLILYGPFRYNGGYTSNGNAEFDLWLKRRNAESGIRDFEKVNELAEKAGLTLSADIDMPANNQLLVWTCK